MTPLMQLQRDFLRLSAESETVTASRCSESATARERRDIVGFGAIEGIITTRPDTPGRQFPLCGMSNGGRSMRLPELAGLRCGDEALFTTGRAGMFGSDDTGPDSSLVGRRKEIPLFSPSGGTIGQDQRRERHAHHLVSTPAVAWPYISPVRVTDQATGSTLTRVVVSVLNGHARSVTSPLRSPHLRGQAGCPGRLGPDSGAGPDRSHRCRDRRANSCPAPTVPRHPG
jgi:hypothetical protein